MFAAEIGHWHIMGCGMWTGTEKGNDTALGLVGCWHPADWPEREIGWLLWQGAGSWAGFGPAAPFLFGAGMALLAAVLFRWRLTN